MVTIVWKESKGTAKSRYKARRAELIAERRSNEALARKIALKLSGCVRADKAASLGSLCCKKKKEVVRKNRSIYYKDSNPLGNKIHAVQKIKLYGKLPYGAY
ncbi:regulator [Escherichia coli]|uniref:regulator n=1 Tax=Escherichia coli TaxID=562 RepID=UPI001CFAA3E1|nr:regulator [Escherichia coli]MCB4621195.1 regulator [Escherichia coli]